eukprot:1242930-Pleurochrysis_carterae.AAC.1
MGMSARTADYLCPQAQRKERSDISDRPSVAIGCVDNVEALGEIKGRLRKLKHNKGFLQSIFEERDKQLFPRDLLVAWVPTRKASKVQSGSMDVTVPDASGAAQAGRRAVGILRRSLRFDKASNRASLYIDFVWVMPEMRGMQIGKKLLLQGILLGRQKDVKLLVAGSKKNHVASSLYESVGFRWTDFSHTEMVLEASQVHAALASKPLSAPSKTPESLLAEPL